MDIIFMEPIYKDYIWGGEKLKNKFNKNTPFKRTAESWEVSTNKNGISKIKNKEYQGKDLRQLFEDKNLREKIFGINCKELKEFPLLIKFIDAKDNLSIQGHPDDEYAKKLGLESGKTEMWYIIECEENGKVIAGLNTKLTSSELQNVIENDNIKDYLNYIDIKQGDSIYIPAGTVHAILKNTLICEIQQNSDITYRIYDWDRKDKDGRSRQLHKKEAIETVKPDRMPIVTHSIDNIQFQKIVESKFFSVEKINSKVDYEDCSNPNTFYAINVLEGRGIVKNDTHEWKINKGDSFIIPATLGKYKIIGEMEFLKSYIGKIS